MTTLSKLSRALSVLLAFAIVGGSLLVVSLDAQAPFRGLLVTPGQYTRPGLTRDPYVFVPGETISFTILATAGEVYDAIVVVRNPTGPRPWVVVGDAFDDRTIPASDELTLEYQVPATLEDGDIYELEVGDQNYIENLQAFGLNDFQRFAIQEYVLQIEVSRPAYLGGDEVIMTWSANKLQDGSLAATGDGQIWVDNTNGDDLRTPNPFPFTTSSGSTTFVLPNLADPNYEGMVEGWFNSTPAPPLRHQWTCVGVGVSYAVRNLGFCPNSFRIDNLGVIVNVGSPVYPPTAIVTVDVHTVVTNNQPNPFPWDPPEPNIIVSISVWNTTGATPVNESQYGASGMRTDAHGDLRYLFQLRPGIADGSTFEVRANATHSNQIWRWGAVDTFTVRDAAASTLELEFNRNEYQAGDTVEVKAVPSGYGTASLIYIFEVRDVTGSFCGAFGMPLLAISTQTLDTYSYTIDDNFAGQVCFIVTVDDGQGSQDTRMRAFNVVFGWLLVNADRQEYGPGDRITVTWELVSIRIVQPRYFYEVLDAAGNLVTSGLAASSFRFTVPTTAPSEWYTFRVTATEEGRAVSGSILVRERTGFFLTLTFDRSSYSAGDTIRAHYKISPRSTSSILPNTFVLSYGLLNGPSRTTSSPDREGDVTYVVPGGIDEGDQLFLAQESNTGAMVIEVISIRGLTVAFATLGDVPVLLIVLLLWLVVITLLLWRKGVLLGPMGPKAAAPPTDTVTRPSEPVYAPASSPMTVTCRSCGSAIDITTSKRPIEVMCPKCGNTEMVA